MAGCQDQLPLIHVKNRQKKVVASLIGRAGSLLHRSLQLIAAHSSPSQLLRLLPKFHNQINNYRSLQLIMTYGGGVWPCAVASAPPRIPKARPSCHGRPGFLLARSTRSGGFVRRNVVPARRRPAGHGEPVQQPGSQVTDGAALHRAARGHPGKVRRCAINAKDDFAERLLEEYRRAGFKP